MFLDESGHPLDRVALLYRGGTRFQLTRGFVWVDPVDGVRHEVPPHDPSRPATVRGNGTDLASVPPFLWGLLASYGRQTLPAILHDRLNAAIPATGPRGRRLRSRRIVDRMFRRALVDAGVPDARATTMWAAVRLQAYWSIARPLGVLVAAQLVVAVAACVAAVALTVLGHPLALLLLLAPGALALPWGSELPFVAAASYLAPLYAPLLLAAAVSSGVEFLIALLLWSARGGRGAAPTPGPLLRAEAEPRSGATATRGGMGKNEGS